MADPEGGGPNLGPIGKRPGPPSPPGTDPKRSRIALPDGGTRLPGSQENPHDLDNTTQSPNLDPLDQPSSSTHSNGNPEAIRPHLPFHQRDGEGASATLGESASGHKLPAREPLLPQFMMSQPLGFWLGPCFRESIAIQNEARLSMMIERIQRGQVEGFVFDRRELAWAGRIAALIQHAQMTADDPYNSDDRSSDGFPAPEEDVPAEPKDIVDATKHPS
ncbi:hypothetical protein LCI18_012882 [Fusarium solani-melongenae]|uniref:Uncharacterized protein n=1 Tax=Fusarium solani subsp. cucurbitae TaxID=2747967 RepID=A0ACD3ZLH9_FUSSC|nr:hypothetical protein LCI18_012882 [Fusarium solani-melongenae]